ncbi:hypothetical protein ACFQ3B_25555 [Stackebrandtia endophytica]|uniref:hypothetical protein n=1 Tax=Stackebrandtia endophytica TaxID=1496996 RepID=UPI0011518FF1|nr:hypothetical protein [Stackebrandtia endophytica]
MKMKLPDAKPGRVIAMVAGPPLEAGISVPIARGHWEAFFDESRGLVRVTRDHEVTESLVEIANGVHVGLNGASLSSFWLLPNFVK